MKTATHHSQHGRPAITVSVECPTFAICHWLGNIHVGTPDADVERERGPQVVWGIA